MNLAAPAAHRRRTTVDPSAASATARAVHQAAAPWPYRQLDLRQLRAHGWRPTPIREFVLKVHQRCNLACDYCYVYTQADQSWRDRPAAMPDEVWRAAVARIAEHVRTHDLREVRAILHGGEPLLYGATRLAALTNHLRAAMPSTCTVTVGLQSNGLRLGPEMMGSLREQRISVGVSVDGVAADHDRHRIMPNGRGSFAAVRAALDLLREPENRACYAGILCVVAPDTDPVACYQQLLEFEPPAIDLLLPHATWQVPPWRPGGSATPYADWLIAVFDRWYRDGDSAPSASAPGGSAPRIRLFEDIIALLFGGSGRSEQVGLSPAALLVVESDGAIEQVDALKSAYPGACATGLDVRRDEFDAALHDPGVVARQIGVAALADQCRSCPIHQVCGGGHYAHRYRPETGFRNPSVYCPDMIRLIGHIRDHVTAAVRQLAPRVSP